VIPRTQRENPMSQHDSLKTLLAKALEGHGWATRSTLANTWRLRGLGKEIDAALVDLQQQGQVAPCDLRLAEGVRVRGFVRVEDLDLAVRLDRVRPRGERGVLLSPFDPLLWDRRRVLQLFDFEQLLEIFKPARQRKFGYYCLPVLAGENLIARVDLKAHRRLGTLEVLSVRYESTGTASAGTSVEAGALAFALDRYAAAVELRLAE
ncbi:MAG: winged helix DNA-binding domain-containing protein, partial [Thermoanaerobaculia bacterium]|nr:winged helix DNA-binding domain-containing protein [Thermoanaerobaculia bacterium]